MRHSEGAKEAIITSCPLYPLPLHLPSNRHKNLTEFHMGKGGGLETVTLWSKCHLPVSEKSLTLHMAE